MCFSSSDTAEMWAEKQAASEAEAFEKAVKRLKPIHFQVDDKYEQAYRQGRLDQAQADQRCIAELREQVSKLREAVVRDQG